MNKYLNQHLIKQRRRELPFKIAFTLMTAALLFLCAALVRVMA